MYAYCVGMTGCRLNAADLIYANMATHYITRSLTTLPLPLLLLLLLD